MRLLSLLLGFTVFASGQVIVTLNLARESNPSAITRVITEDSVLRDADFLLFQEVYGNTADEVGKQLHYFVAARASAAESPNQGLAILSKYPLSDVKVIPLKRYDLRFRSRVRFALAATAETPSGPVRLWNVHLDSRINPTERLEQIAPVLEDAKQYSGPVLFGGDLNTTNFQWTLHVFPTRMGDTQRTAMRVAFEEAGFQTPLPDNFVTFPFLNQHLDWVFARGLTPQNFGVAASRFSDHYAVWVKFTR